jgi:16S rRNA (guanine1516-N2)-methyltransferase
LQQDVARIVVKRPLRAPHLGAVLPSHSVVGKTVRFDVHVRRKLA